MSVSIARSFFILTLAIVLGVGPVAENNSSAAGIESTLTLSRTNVVDLQGDNVLNLSAALVFNGRDLCRTESVTSIFIATAWHPAVVAKSGETSAAFVPLLQASLQTLLSLGIRLQV